ncbi:ROK family protein [Mycolicibacterium sp. 018/SC-01/001]|uniref:ROK family transcriptional regulator n=1 Tax=Mycolicibacterium sp. 018/SC-01/001 TaxID=2592069 RepID=UPI00117F79FB|nr:ROK family transcriptional regulator [Mycolicibacterium sp. 018/SC-01/001]TRW79339.1 ROK family protein [Mycolicibacterium sp. 018/SC-01/001]
MHAERLRWHTAAQLLGVMREEPGITRAAAAARLGIGSGSASELTARLRGARLLDETPAVAQRRGRPTMVLGAHPQGPLVCAADLRAADWRLAVAGIDGLPDVVAREEYGTDGLTGALSRMSRAIGAVYRRHPDRIVALSVSVAGTVSDAKLVQFTARGSRDVDLSVLTAKIPRRAGVAVVLGNDATLAGVAEACTGAARGVATALHLMVAQGIGGALVVGGEPVAGGHGAAGEYGHIPFGDPDMRCPCGARGCWDLTVDGRALARHLGEPEPADPVGYVHSLVGRQDVLSRRAFQRVAISLGRGIGALVNLHDPQVVTLGGVAALLRAQASDEFDAAFHDALMAFRKTSPPPVRDAQHGEDGPLQGAVLAGLDHVTSPDALAAWAARPR